MSISSDFLFDYMYVAIFEYITNYLTFAVNDGVIEHRPLK